MLAIDDARARGNHARLRGAGGTVGEPDAIADGLASSIE